MYIYVAICVSISGHIWPTMVVNMAPWSVHERSGVHARAMASFGCIGRIEITLLHIYTHQYIFTERDTWAHIYVYITFTSI